MRRALNAAGWALVVPLAGDGRLMGLVALGPKRSGEPFYVEDLDALTTLANHAASARARAENLAALQRLTQMLAHEIGNPLVPIKTLAQLLPARVGDQAFASDVSRIVSRELERIEGLVARLRSLAPTAEPIRATVDLRVPIRHAIEVVGAEAAGQATRIDVTLASAPVQVRGDSAELEELFLNLLTNAIEAVVDRETERSIRISVVADRERAVATVRDSGPGIRAEVIHRLFETCVTTKPQGSGLGLAICKTIAERHRGRLTAANAAEGGAVFILELPVAVQAAPRSLVADLGAC